MNHIHLHEYKGRWKTRRGVRRPGSHRRWSRSVTSLVTGLDSTRLGQYMLFIIKRNKARILSLKKKQKQKVCTMRSIVEGLSTVQKSEY